MATNYLAGKDGAPLPDGIVLQHTLYGEPDNTVTSAYTASGADGVALIPAGDGVDWDPDTENPSEPAAVTPRSVEPTVAPDRAKRCRAKNDTCMGWRISGSDFCAAHAGVFKNPGRPAASAEQ